MKKMICEGNGIAVKDYLEEKRVYTLDMKFESKEELERFLNLHEKYSFKNGMFQFEIDGKHFAGWFGEMLYDEKFNVRAYVGIYDENEELSRDKNGKVYGVGGCALRLGKAMRELCNMLEENGILKDGQKDKIIESMNVPETMAELRYLVHDLPAFLEESYTTIEDLRKW